MKPLFPKLFRLLGIFIGLGINALFAWMLWPTVVVVLPMFLGAICLLALGQELLTKRPRSISEDVVDRMRG